MNEKKEEVFLLLKSKILKENARYQNNDFISEKEIMDTQGGIFSSVNEEELLEKFEEVIRDFRKRNLRFAEDNVKAKNNEVKQGEEDNIVNKEIFDPQVSGAAKKFAFIVRFFILLISICLMLE